MKLAPEERAFLDAFWGTGWTMSQAEKALANLLAWKRSQTIRECINVIDDAEGRSEAEDRWLDRAFAALRRLDASPNESEDKP